MDYPGKNIYKAARENAHLTQEQAAELMDKSVSCIRKWESYAFKEMLPDNIAEMAYQYNSSVLVWQWLKLFSPFKDDLPDIDFIDNIKGLALYLNDAKIEYDEWHNKLMEYLNDGNLDRYEKNLWLKSIIPTGWEYVGKLISLIVLCDEMMGVQKEGQQPMISIALSEEQINSIIKSAVKNRKIEINTIINESQKQWFTVAEAADYIGVNKQTIYQYVD